jgi:hypothetical protein
LLLVDPSDGYVCEVTEFTDYVSPPNPPQPGHDVRDWIPARGDIAWSPSGRALAFAVIGTQPFRQDVYVLSVEGLVGPVLTPQRGLALTRLAWAPDGSWLAATETNTGVEPTGELGIVFAHAEYGRSKMELACDRPCWGRDSFISPDGERIAVAISGRVAGSESGPGSTWRDLVVAEVSSANDQHIGNETGLLDTRELVGWNNSDELLLAEGGTLDMRLLGVFVDRSIGNLDYGPGAWPPSADADEIGLSRDGSRRIWIQADDQGRGELFVAERPANLTGPPGHRTIATLDGPWGASWWSPDGGRIGYLIDVQTENQGVWIIEPDGSANEPLALGAFVIPDNSRRVWQPVW